MTGGYSEKDRERFVPEDRASSAKRGEFARDRARVLHSSALRRLGAKTQVLSPTGGDFARTRLTHSLEVAQVGREMASALGIDPDVVDTACLAHDLGHPPFGHNGERALNVWAADIGGFEGNAQTLRLISRIEPKVFDSTGQSRGLNLTRASLDASCKYPFGRSAGWQDAGADQSIKFGYYEEDREVFEFLRLDAPNGQKCIEAAVMDFADDVAYSVHDFEDAVVASHVDLQELIERAKGNELFEQVSSWSGDRFTIAQLRDAFERLTLNEFWSNNFNGSHRSLGKLKNLTSALIGSLVSRSTEQTQLANAGEYLVRYQGVLVVPESVATEIAVLKGVVSAFLMNQEKRQPYYEWQRAILMELADALFASGDQHLDQYFAGSWQLARSSEDKRRVIVDQVASLTDVSALNLHNRLVGSSK